MDPYASLCIGGRTYRTKANDGARAAAPQLRVGAFGCSRAARLHRRQLRVRALTRRGSAGGGINPVWSEHFAFALGPADTALKVAVYDTARLGTDECVGDVSIPLQRVFANGRDDGRYSLEHKSKVVGELSLIMVFTAHHAPGAAPTGILADPPAPAAPVPIGTAVPGAPLRFAGMVPLPEVNPKVSETVLPNFKPAAPEPPKPPAGIAGMHALPTAPPPAPPPAPAPPPQPVMPQPQPGYGAPVQGYGAPVQGYGGAPPVQGYGAPPPAPYGAPQPRASLPGAAGYSSAPQGYGGPVAGYAPGPHLPSAQGYAVALQVPHHSSVPSSVMGIYPGTPTVPILLLDTTGSMNFPSSARAPTPRRELVRDALGALVASVERRQGQAAVGLRTVAFSGGAALDLGYLSSPDFAQQWQRLSWQGGTYITPAWQVAYGTFAAEAGASGAVLLALLLTDGEAADLQALEAALLQDPRVFVLVALVGFGADHDASFVSFQGLAARNQRVKLVSFTGEQNARAIGDTLSRIVLFG